MKKHLFASEKGFTLIELMAVVIIIIILVALMVFGASYANRKASVEQAATDIKTIEVALEAYRLDHGTYPNNVAPGNNLGSYLIPKYLTSWPTSRLINGQTTLVDPFFINYYYNYPSTLGNTANPATGASGGYDLWSCGPNRIDDTTPNHSFNDDITSWKR